MSGGGTANAGGNINVSANSSSGAATSNPSSTAITKSSIMFRQFAGGTGRRQHSGKGVSIQKI